MKVSSARKAAGMALTAVAVLALATGSAFAGQGNGSYNGNKYGAHENKPGNTLCADGYYLIQGDNGADINGNGYVCEKLTPSGYTWVDDSTSTTRFTTT